MSKESVNKEQLKKRDYYSRQLLYDSEGLLDYCQAAFDYEDPNDRRCIGWNLGRQIIAQHVVELALKVELAKYRQAVPKNHDFRYLFNALPARRRKKAESTYQAILRCKVKETWDVFRTVDSFLEFLGDKPTVETRYYWENSARSNQLGVHYFSNLIAPDNYVHLIYALMIAFHNYPTQTLIRRYETKFNSLKKSLEADHDEEGRRALSDKTDLSRKVSARRMRR